jgi:DNA-binding transcriptional ArsR family regulator
MVRTEWFVYHRTMEDGAGIARIAGLIGDPTRAGILTALLAGQALTASELAHTTRVTKQTISAHLAKLLDAELIATESQGRHRYVRLADRHVAHLLESLIGVVTRRGTATVLTGPREPALRKARVCYDHLAGELGVLAFESLQQRRLLRLGRGGLDVTDPGRRFFRALGIEVDSLERGRRPLCRLCLDWSVRRHHLAGVLGAALLQRCLELRWARRARGSRVLHFSALGEDALRRRFPLPELPETA